MQAVSYVHRNRTRPNRFNWRRWGPSANLCSLMLMSAILQFCIFTTVHFSSLNFRLHRLLHLWRNIAYLDHLLLALPVISRISSMSGTSEATDTPTSPHADAEGGGLPRPGVRIAVLWDDRDTVFEGTVAAQVTKARSPTHVRIRYDDGDDVVHDVDRMQWRCCADRRWRQPGDLAHLLRLHDRRRRHHLRRRRRKAKGKGGTTVTVTAKAKVMRLVDAGPCAVITRRRGAIAEAARKPRVSRGDSAMSSTSTASSSMAAPARASRSTSETVSFLGECIEADDEHLEPQTSPTPSTPPTPSAPQRHTDAQLDVQLECGADLSTDAMDSFDTCDRDIVPETILPWRKRASLFCAKRSDENVI